MTAGTTRRHLTGLLALVLIVLGAPWTTTSQVVSAQSQSLFISFTDADGVIGEATGGSYKGLSSPNGYRTLLPQLADDLARKHRLVSNQYRLTYAPPEGASDRPAIRVLTTRTRINMFPTRDGNVP